MPRLLNGWLLFSSLFVAGAAWATTARLDDAIQAVKLEPGHGLVLDGSLDHPQWQRAPVWQRFIEKDPQNGAAPPQTTRVQVLFDEQAIYVGITALDTTPALIRDVPVRNDGVNRTQDFVVVYLDPIGSKRSAQFFRVNAAGSLADGIHTAADDSEDFSPDFDWDAAVQRTAQGWTAVLRLPFASLRFAEGADQQWRIMVARRLPRQQFHLLASVPIPRDVPSFIHTLQPLLGVELPEQHSFLTLRPSLTLRRSSEREPGQARQGKNDSALSLDLKWRPRAELVLDATLKPDFSQVAVDVPQLAGNSRFALYFPEKRPFFFESADLLRSPTEAFYTRSFTQPRWGLRSTWRGPAWAGSALAVDDEGGGQVLLPGPYGTGALKQPASQTLAARVRRDEGALQWGAVLASRRYAGGRGDNQVLGPDVGWQIDDTWRLRGQWLASSTTAWRGAGGELARGPVVDGQRQFLKLYRQAEDGESSLGLDLSDAGFRHDTGFVNQAGVSSLTAFHSRGWNVVGPFNRFYVNVEVDQVRDRRSGELIKQVVRPGIWAAAARNLEWWAEWYARSQLRTAAGAPLLDEQFLASGLVMSPAPWFPLIDTSLSLGRLADTAANAVRPGARWALNTKLRPWRPLELETRLSGAWLNHEGQRSYRESAGQLLAVWHFDARHTLRAIVQRSSLERRAEAGVQAEASRSGSESLTYTWRQSAGTLLYVGASQSTVKAGPRANEAFVKLQFDIDEVRPAWR